LAFDTTKQMPLFTSKSSTSSFMYDDDDSLKASKSIHFTPRSRNSLPKPLSVSNSTLTPQTVSEPRTTWTSFLTTTVSSFFSNSFASLKACLSSDSTVSPKSISQTMVKTTSSVVTIQEPNVDDVKNNYQPIRRHPPLLTKLLPLGSFVSQSPAVLAFPSPSSSAPSSPSSHSPQKLKNVKIKYDKSELYLPPNNSGGLALISPSGKSIKVKCVPPKEVVPASKRIHRLGTLQGKTIPSKVNCWRHGAKNSPSKAVASNATCLSHQGSSNASIFVASPSLSHTGPVKVKRPVSKIGPTFNLPLKASQPNQGDVPKNRVKEYIELASKLVASCSNLFPIYSSSVPTQPAGKVVRVCPTLSQSPASTLLRPSSPPMVQLTKRLDQVGQLRRRDTLTPELWKEVVSEHKQYEAHFAQHVTSFPFKPSLPYSSSTSSNQEAISQASSSPPKSLLPSPTIIPKKPELNYFVLPRNGPAYTMNLRPYSPNTSKIPFPH
ncbi:hypothetical protein HMI54_001891, partial [Coelomomyces lativittatus]